MATPPASAAAIAEYYAYVSGQVVSLLLDKKFQWSCMYFTHRPTLRNDITHCYVIRYFVLDVAICRIMMVVRVPLIIFWKGI